MNRLPINPLLYAAILALLGGSGWHFYQAAFVEQKSDEQKVQDREANRNRFERHLGRGADSAGQVAVGPDYGQPREFWDALRDANFNGEEPPPPPEDPGAGAAVQEVVETPQTPLEDIFVLTVIAAAGADSRIVISYKPEANVELPPEMVAAAGNAGFDSVAAPGGRRPPMPAYGGGLGPSHLMILEEPLWKPYDHIRLVRVIDDAAVFVREDAELPQEEWKEESIYPEVLALSQEVLKQLREGLGIATATDRAVSDDEGTGPVQSSGWQPLPETVEVAANRFNIGTRDREVFRSDPERIFNEDVGTADWRSSRGTMRGVRITRLAPGYQRYGVQQGEIIIALNGEPVSSKTQAIKVGKALYKRGVRTFDVEFLTPTGQRITRSYVAPDED